MFVLALISVIFITAVQGYTTDYCDKKLCLRYKHGEYVYEHNIGCDVNYGYTANCPANARLQEIGPKLKHLILHLHNRHRDKIAKGQLQGYAQAQRMTTMLWDDELAYLAQLNAFRCYYGADSCRNTAKFRHVGQNIDVYWSSAGYVKDSKIIRRIFRTWFREYSETNMAVIYAYYNSGRVVGHFTQIVSEKSARVGCALIKWSLPTGNHMRYYEYFVCNYSFTNYDRQPVYVVGKTASGCVTGVNSHYTGLCSIYENVPPVPTYIKKK